MKSVEGVVKKDKKTKHLISRLNPGDIALIHHSDLDLLSAKKLCDKKVSAVINVETSVTGRYRNLGPSFLYKAGIPVIDDVDEKLFSILNEGDSVEIRDGMILKNGSPLAEGTLLTQDVIHDKLQQARRNVSHELKEFVKNTLGYLVSEQENLLGEISFPDIGMDFTGRHVLVVVRGKNYQEDLNALRSYISEMKPVLIGVDGGSDALVEFGYTPDITVGDMDSVSDRTLKSSRRRVVHAYPDGRAPGLSRVQTMGLESVTVPISGMSEDLALLLAYHLGAELIVGVGMHFSLDEFLEKDRKGMSSTFLVRLKVGSILFDAKGVSQLYKGRMSASWIAGIILCGLVPILAILFTSPVFKPYLKLLRLLIQKNLGI